MGVIAEAVGGLEKRHLACWLAGGWAVDFLIGRVTREHRDIDIVIWAADASAATEAMRDAGFELQAARAPELIHFEREGVPVTLSFIEREADGTLVTPGKWRDWPWPPDSLSAPRGRIGSLTIPIVSLASQIETKSNYAAHIHRAPLRPQDEVDLSLLYAFREQTRVSEQSTGSTSRQSRKTGRPSAKSVR
jgi:hypothetical protein